MEFDTFLFDAFSQLSGGLITDMQTLLLGLLLLGMILMGADMLIEKLQMAGINSQAEGNFKVAQWAHAHREQADRGTFEYDYYNSLYQKHLSNSVSLKSKRFRGSDYDV